jgi:hypothetical protein
VVHPARLLSPRYADSIKACTAARSLAVARVNSTLATLPSLLDVPVRSRAMSFRLGLRLYR